MIEEHKDIPVLINDEMEYKDETRCPWNQNHRIQKVTSYDSHVSKCKDKKYLRKIFQCYFESSHKFINKKALKYHESRCPSHFLRERYFLIKAEDNPEIDIKIPFEFI